VFVGAASRRNAALIGWFGLVAVQQVLQGLAAPTLATVQSLVPSPDIAVLTACVFRHRAQPSRGARPHRTTLVSRVPALRGLASALLKKRPQ
jgi:hypothetical protein